MSWICWYLSLFHHGNLQLKPTKHSLQKTTRNPLKSSKIMLGTSLEWGLPSPLLEGFASQSSSSIKNGYLYTSYTPSSYQIRNMDLWGEINEFYSPIAQGMGDKLFPFHCMGQWASLTSPPHTIEVMARHDELHAWSDLQTHENRREYPCGVCPRLIRHWTRY